MYIKRTCKTEMPALGRNYELTHHIWHVHVHLWEKDSILSGGVISGNVRK